MERIVNALNLIMDCGNFSDEFELPVEEIKPVGEEFWAALQEVAITAANPEAF